MNINNKKNHGTKILIVILIFFALLSFIIVLGSTQTIFADRLEQTVSQKIKITNPIENEQSLDSSISLLSGDRIISSYKAYNGTSRWTTGHYFDLYPKEKYVIVDIENHAPYEVQFAIANNNKFINTKHVGKIYKNSAISVRIPEKELRYRYPQEPTSSLFIQITAPGKQVKGSYKIRSTQ